MAICPRQAVDQTKDFATDRGDSNFRNHDLFKNYLPIAEKFLKKGLAFKCEGLLIVALCQLKDASAGTQKWAKDIIRGQLGEMCGGQVDEDLVHKVLADSARATIG